MGKQRAAGVAALFLIVSATFVARVSAHDIPRDVTLQAFAKPEGQTFQLRDAAMIWLARKIELYEDDAPVADPRIVSARMSLESDRSFETYDGAVAHVMGPALTNSTSIFWEQGILDVLFDYPIHSDRSRFAIHMAFDRLAIRVVTAVRFILPDGVVRPYELDGDAGL